MRLGAATRGARAGGAGSAGVAMAGRVAAREVIRRYGAPLRMTTLLSSTSVGQSLPPGSLHLYHEKGVGPPP